MPLFTTGGASGRERTRFAYAVFCLSKARSPTAPYSVKLRLRLTKSAATPSAVAASM